MLHKLLHFRVQGAWDTSRDLLLNFGTPSKERLKIETLNFVCGLTDRRPIQKVAKLGQLGIGPESRNLLCIYIDAYSSVSLYLVV